MKVICKFFASARQYIGQDSLSLFLPYEESTLNIVLQILKDKHNFPQECIDKCSFSKNSVFCNRNVIVKDGDEIGILPPFGGG